MPIFEFKCSDCGKSFEHLLMSSDSSKPKCPACGSEKLEKQLSTFAAGGNSKSGADGFSCPSGGCCPGCTKS